jgi:TonB family protein
MNKLTNSYFINFNFFKEKYFKKSNLFFYGISISLHFTLMLSLILFFDKTQEKILLGDTAELAIQSYAYQERLANTVHSRAFSVTQDFMQSNTMGNVKNTSTSLSLAKIGSSKKQNHGSMSKNLDKNLNSSLNHNLTQQQQHLQQQHQTGQRTEQLLALLHAAIQSHQNYPLAAMEMQRQGRATITFRLFPDGKIDNVHLEHSSGTDSLDQAALTAVQAAAPFDKTKFNLAFTQEFSIDVVFELA